MSYALFVRYAPRESIKFLTQMTSLDKIGSVRVVTIRQEERRLLFTAIS